MVSLALALQCGQVSTLRNWMNGVDVIAEFQGGKFSQTICSALCDTII